ncbi:MAG: 2-amino-4-hydroxy-6-hydroxymethyldihydropteridine diphosphokinase [Planctomycetes bacterium]|nr:2-amino-4-hydroxy-6-hydroxymethyldihydropteridine diphosphokinase [Planctomycetota bacterium]
MAAYVTAFIGLGSNLGDREKNLRDAYELLGKLPQTNGLRLSSLIETKPVDSPAGSPDFMNAVAKIETKLPPRDLLKALLGIEKQLGRDRSGVRNEPRTLDLDLLLYGDKVVNEPDLVVPHPRMHQREFVLWPLLQIDSRVRDPRTGDPFADAYQKLKGHP